MIHAARGASMNQRESRPNRNRGHPRVKIAIPPNVIEERTLSNVLVFRQPGAEKRQKNGVDGWSIASGCDCQLTIEIGLLPDGE